MIPRDDGLKRMRAKLSNRIVYNLRLSVSSENIKKWIGQLVSDILKLDGKNHVSSGPVVKVAVEKFVWGGLVVLQNITNFATYEMFDAHC